MRRQCRAKIVATLGPASSTPEMIRALVEAGADVFRLNFSHGSHDEHRARYDIIRAIEQETGRPIGILADLQGPKLRVGRLAAGPIELGGGRAGALRPRPGAGQAASGCRCRIPEVFAALAPGRPAADRRRQDPARGRGRPSADARDGPGAGRRHALRPQGGQRGRRRAAGLGPDREGPRRPRLRARAGRRLGGAVLRAAAGGPGRGPRRWPAGRSG